MVLVVKEKAFIPIKEYMIIGTRIPVDFLYNFCLCLKKFVNFRTTVYLRLTGCFIPNSMKIVLGYIKFNYYTTYYRGVSIIKQ